MTALSSSNGALWRVIPAPRKTEVVALRTARAKSSYHWSPSLMCTSFALDTYAGKDLHLPALTEADTARIDSSDKGSTDVVSPNHARWKVHHVAHKEAETRVRRAKCCDVEAAAGGCGKSVRVLIAGGPLRGLDGTGFPKLGNEVFGLVVGHMVELMIAGWDVDDEGGVAGHGCSLPFL